MPMVRFGDVAERVNTKEDRFNTDLVYYVGGDHIETNELKVSGRGIIKEADLGPMFYFGFKPGDILFVTRNPHLRKSAKVDFAGICSEKTLVIATKDENVLLQDYLAGVMQSDDFWDFMEENKSGSVNYFINWSTLADYEFDLPPIEKQRELAELLWAANDLKESYKKLIVATDEMLKAKFREMFGECDVQRRNLMQISRPKQWPTIATKDMENSGYPVYGANGVIGFSSQFNHEGPTILIACRGASCGVINITEGRSYVNGNAMALDDIDNDIVDWRYLGYYLRNYDFSHIISGSAQPQITREGLKKVTIPLPPLSLQQEFVEIARKADETKAALKKSIADVESVIKGLING